jgi:hypothetical protein
MYTIYKNIDVFLKTISDSNITFCVGTNGVLDMIRNLIFSAKMVNINIIVFALDEEIVKNLEGNCDIVCFFDNIYTKNISSEIFYKYGESNFKDVVFQRFFIGNQILKQNKSYIYIDVDIVINLNFVDDVLKKFKNTDYDCLIQYNGTNGCTGFYSMIPSKNTLSLDYEFFVKNNYLNFSHDQDFFNIILFQNKLLNINFLPREDYPNGGYFYKNENIKDKCYIIHFNGIIGYEKKINRMKLYNKWFI